MRQQKPAVRAWAVVFWLLVWQGASLALRAIYPHGALLLASPIDALHRLFELALTAAFWQTVGISAARILGGFLVSCVLALGLAALSARFRRVEELLSPLVAAVKAVPVASFIILALVWLSAGNVPILTGLLIVMPVVYANVTEGVDSTDPQLLEMAHMFGWSETKIWRRVLLPSALPAFLTACEACVGMCFKATIAAEVIGVPRNAMGTQLYNAKVYLETDALLAWTVVIIALSMLTEKLLGLAFERGKKRAHHP